MHQISTAEAIAFLKAQGYRVSKPRAPRLTVAQRINPGTNAVGKPFSASYDPNYRMKYKAGSTAHLFKPYSSDFSQHLTK